MKNFFCFSLLSSLLLLTACDDEFLEQPPRAALTVGAFPVTESDAILALNGAYNSLRTWQIGTGGYPILDIMSDETAKGSNPGDGTFLNAFDRFEHTATDPTLEAWYKTLYEAIRRANLVINEVPKIDMEGVLQDRIIAEARFLRAFHYSTLVRGFGDVPLVTVIDPPLDLDRTSVDIILNEIVYPDLEFAITFLPERSQYPPEDLGRATKGAARGLMARTKLFYGDYEAVERFTRDIIESEEYELVADYADVFTGLNEHNEESLFEISATPEEFVNGGNQFGNTQGVRGTPNRGWGFNRPVYPWIRTMENNNDPRLDPSVIFLREVIDGILITGDGATPDTTYSDGVITAIEAYNQKTWMPGTDALSSWGHNRRIIRYADVLLMHAEALNENNKAADALIYLNQVRERARNGDDTVLPDVETTDKNELREAILRERTYELAFEGLRFWDLVRTNKAEDVLGPLGFLKNKNELLPIPQSEIDISQGRITQNTGY